MSAPHFGQHAGVGSSTSDLGIYVARHWQLRQWNKMGGGGMGMSSPALVQVGGS